MNIAGQFQRRIWWAVRPVWLWRLIRLCVRSLWLAGGLALGLWLASLHFGWALSRADWASLAVTTFALTLALLLFWPVHLSRLIRRMDRLLALHDQLSTAYEVARRGPQNYVEVRLLETAENLLGQTRGRLTRAHPVPWGDLEMCLLVAAVGYACSLGLTLSPSTPRPADSIPLPALGAEPTFNLPGLPPELSAGPPAFVSPGAAALSEAPLKVDPLTAQALLDTLTQALGGPSLTQSAAAALARGDSVQAAEDLRTLSNAVQSLSPQSLQALGYSLQEATDMARDYDPDTAAQMAQLAAALLGKDAQAAAQALENLAQLVQALDFAATGGQGNREANTFSPGRSDEPSGSSEGSQEHTAGLGASTQREEQSEGATDRLKPDGQVVELPAGELPANQLSVLRPADQDSSAGPRRSTLFAQAQATGQGGGQLSDPLSYPWRLRSVVQQYFSPP